MPEEKKSFILSMNLQGYNKSINELGQMKIFLQIKVQWLFIPAVCVEFCIWLSWVFLWDGVFLLLMRRISQGADSYMFKIEVHNKSSYIV